MEFRCKLSEVDDLIFALVFDQTCYARKEPIRTYEVHPTEESLGWGRSMVCEFDYTVHIPALKLFYVTQLSMSMMKKNRKTCR